MKVLLVDDEPFAVQYLQHLIEQIGHADICGVSYNAAEAIALAELERPDVVFMDIQMPEMDGLMAAEHIKSLLPNTHIVFVTAYDEYAIQAFEVNAIDYLLKPVGQERLTITMNRLQAQYGQRTPVESDSRPLLIRCFQRISMERQEPIEIKWRTTKGLELFAYLLHHRERVISKESIIDSIWPDVLPDKALVQLYGAVYHLRRAFQELQLPMKILNRNNGYVLQLQSVQVDVEEWERLVRSLPLLNRDSLLAYKRCVEMFSGDYLEDHGYLWAESERERIRTVWLDIALKLGSFYYNQMRWHEALEVYTRITYFFPVHETAHYHILNIYANLDNWPALDQHYTDLNKLLEEEYGTAIYPDLESWYSANKFN